ncbi:spore cortex biosynthesis protein YabQ [Clostridium acidisoli DSM 12555]|jgi:spore cortex biosynthesis protein YabQ|uniref:Spore cortex biosynthesis protein YabQ n=1 Tax=Clostridium acidisoli DSM 12555 TaxID=1121291 RepID=A0A1W1XWL8_9CLOT|nr:spore cortex biosynthesis protein YabQ [Clostridium acidisoli]SMC28326.1 spore cortex biosynthesis protein YabQ [Clostridium acidisoli DSM 12555]
MVLSNFTQFNQLFYSLVGGIFTGILFDIYRSIRGTEVVNKIIAFIEDMLFWILVSLIIFIFLFYKDGAILTVYSYAFIAIGVYFYFKILSKKFLPYEIKLFNHLVTNFRILYNIILYPFRLLINYLFNK